MLETSHHFRHELEEEEEEEEEVEKKEHMIRYNVCGDGIITILAVNQSFLYTL